MKRTLLVIGLLALVSTAKAADLVTNIPLIDSRYSDTNATLALSSFTVATIAAESGYREIKLQNSTSFFYVEDGTAVAATIRSNGISVAADAVETIENNQAINVILPVNSSATTARYRKRVKGI